MSAASNHMSLMVLVTGAGLVASMLARALLGRTVVPPLVGYLAIGLALRLAQDATGFMPESHGAVFAFLGKVGLVTLLFRVGLESDLGKLLGEFGKAGVLALFNVAGAGFMGFAAAHWLLGYGMVPSLFVAVAFTATSVGVTVALWQDAGILDTAKGRLLLDLAELDDIVGVALMALLFSLAPVLHGGGEGLVEAAVAEGWVFFLTFCLFLMLCFAFSRYLEGSVSRYLHRAEPDEGYMLSVAGMGFMIAALAGLLGFSLAIGAFFAGLLFSRDPEAVHEEASFLPVWSFFSPFFFIHIGMLLDPSTLFASVDIRLVLLACAVAAKLLFTGLPALAFMGPGAALLLGVSMVPRAEIALVVMERGLALGPWAVPQELFGAMVLVCAATCLVTPILLKLMLRRPPELD